MSSADYSWQMSFCIYNSANLLTEPHHSVAGGGKRDVYDSYKNRKNDELVHVYAGEETISATPEHPFYVRDRGWTGAVDLRAGDLLVLQDGGYVIVEKIQHEILEQPVKVYNFEVEEFHTYYVGSDSVLVHNMCALERGVGGKGWVGDRTWRMNLKAIDAGGTIETLNGGLPTELQAKSLIEEAGGRYLRTEGPHKRMNPHKYLHINYY